MKIIDEIMKKYQERYEELKNCQGYPGFNSERLYIIKDFIEDLKSIKNKCSIKYILFVEDGSIDVETEKESLEQLGYKIIVCRQGANTPMILEVNNG